MVGWMVPQQRKPRSHTTTKGTHVTDDCTAVTIIGMKQGINTARRGGDKLGATALLAGAVVLMLCILFYMAEHPRVPLRRFTPSWASKGGGEPFLWDVIAQRANDRLQSGRRLTVLFMGDSITDGSAARTKHPRFQKSGSCSYRYSFINAVTGGAPTFQNARSKPIPIDALEAVGPFTSNCGDHVVPSKCLVQLSDRLGVRGDVVASTRPFVRHGATSGIRATTLLNGESWLKKASEFERSGLADPPERSPDTVAMETLFRTKFPQRNVSDIAVWVSQYRPDVVVYLLGTNDIRWGTPVEDLLDQHLPRVVLETLLFTESPLIANGIMDEVAAEQKEMCKTFVFVSTLYPRRNFSHEVKAFNKRLLAMRDLRRSSLSRPPSCEGYSRPTSAVGDIDLSSLARVLLCESCVRIVDGGATALWESRGQVPKTMEWESFVDRLTFDGLHPTDEGDVALGRQLAFEIMSL